MVTSLNDLAMFQNNNRITVSNRRKSVRDHKHGTALHQVVHTFLYDTFCTGIDTGSCFIQNQYRWVCNCCPRNGQKLSLPLREFFTIPAQHRIVSFREHLYKLICMCQFCCCIDFFIRCIQLAITDIITNRTGKQMCVLKNDSKRMSQIILFDLGNIDSIITDLAFLDIIKTIDQIGYGCLTGSGRADECQFLSGLRIQADIVKNCFVFIISKGYILKSYITFQLCIGYGAICRMRMFPCPHAGSLFAFYNVAIFLH